MTERMKTFIYCAITAVVTTIVVSVGRPEPAMAQARPNITPLQNKYIIHHLISFGSGPDAGTLIIKQK